MSNVWIRRVTWFLGIGLMLQGTVTLLFRLVPALDRAVPVVLAATGMIAPHSLLHIVSAGIAYWTLRQGGTTWPRRFLLGFGAFYLALAAAGWGTGGQFGLGLQPFDHPFHLAIGLLAFGTGLLARGRPNAAMAAAG